MDKEFQLLLRLFEKGKNEPLEVLQEYYHKLIRMRGTCGRCIRVNDFCCLPKGHSGFHASEWISSPLGSLHRTAWNCVSIDGKYVLIAPPRCLVDYDYFLQSARYGGWRLYIPLVPYPLEPETLIVPDKLVSTDD